MAWALAHPFMAFFVLLSLSYTMRVVVRGWPPPKPDADPDGDSDA